MLLFVLLGFGALLLVCFPSSGLAPRSLELLFSGEGRPVRLLEELGASAPDPPSFQNGQNRRQPPRGLPVAEFVRVCGQRRAAEKVARSLSLPAVHNVEGHRLGHLHSFDSSESVFGVPLSEPPSESDEMQPASCEKPLERLYCFDFDDTIASTNCRIWTVTGPVSTEEYATMKKQPLCRDSPFREFDDVDGCDVRPAPYLATFVEALVEGSPIAIITARDHDPKNFLRLVERAAKMRGAVLHDRVHLYCCNWPGWALPGRTREERKCAAILDFVGRYPGAVSVGFSDDDPENIRAVRTLFDRLSSEAPHLKWRIYPCGAAAAEERKDAAASREDARASS